MKSSTSSVKHWADQMDVPQVPDLDELERRFGEAFEGGDDGTLDVIGYGEISAVVRWETEDGPVAVKRLPSFSDSEELRLHVDLMSEYVRLLNSEGIDVVPTSFQEEVDAMGANVAFAIQKLVDPAQLAANALRAADPSAGEEILKGIIERTASLVGQPVYGLDAQVSNWVIAQNEISYLDITTPFMRDPETGVSRLDTEIFVASLPRVLRWPVKRFVAGGIVAQYFDLRTVLTDLVANLNKERAEGLIPVAVRLANRHLEEPLTVREVERYYARDLRMWAVLQRLRRADRWWQVKVRRRPYPVLLPGRIDR